MLTERFDLSNRHNEKIKGLINRPKKSKGSAVIVHGLGGHKEEKVLEVIARTFVRHDITAVRFDATNGVGESGGSYENATTTNFIEDLEDVINFARGNAWFPEPYYLSGHSLGSLATLIYAENNPEKVRAIAPIATVVSGALTAEVRGKAYLKDWEQRGRRRETDPHRLGLKWSHMLDRMRYDACTNAAVLTMPLLMVVGDQDKHTPVEHQRVLFEHIPHPKEFHIIHGGRHELDNPQHLQQVVTIFSAWLDKVTV